MLKMQHIKKTYGTGKNSKEVLHDFNLELNEGEIFGFIGSNGAGKTTTIKIATGILNFEEGTVEICNYNLKTDPLKAKKQFGYVSDSHLLYEQLTGREYINFIADVFRISYADRKKRADEMIEVLELKDAIDSYIASYSHGMKQKISIIGALIHSPKLWILDEPLTGLDPKSSFLIKEIMKKESKKGNTVFFSTHILEIAEKLCDRVGIISEGKIAKIGTLEEIKKEASLEDYFLKISSKAEGTKINE